MRKTRWRRSTILVHGHCGRPQLHLRPAQRCRCRNDQGHAGRIQICRGASGSTKTACRCGTITPAATWAANDPQFAHFAGDPCSSRRRSSSRARPMPGQPGPMSSWCINCMTIAATSPAAPIFRRTMANCVVAARSALAMPTACSAIPRRRPASASIRSPARRARGPGVPAVGASLWRR